MLANVSLPWATSYMLHDANREDSKTTVSPSNAATQITAITRPRTQNTYMNLRLHVEVSDVPLRITLKSDVTPLSRHLGPSDSEPQAKRK
jgi:hypothetical protein